MMTRAELEGVIAHELSHVRNRDILLMTVAVVLAGFLAIIADSIPARFVLGRGTA
jgi:heat shock protein HtpX